MLRVVVLVCALAVGRACEVCVAGVCQQRNELVRGFTVTDLALDRDSRVLYVQTDHLSTIALDLHHPRIERVQLLNTSALAVDQDAHTLYTAQNTTLYRYSRDEDSLEIASNKSLYWEPNLMFYKEKLYYTTKYISGLHFIKNEEIRRYLVLDNYTITDFVVNKNKTIYFVSDDKLYFYHDKEYHTPELIANKSYVLSVDKSGDVYLGDATANGIYKLEESNRMVAYAAYADDTVDRFVFDHENNIVFHDPVKDTVSYWKPMGTPCAIELPRSTFSIKEVSPN